MENDTDCCSSLRERHPTSRTTARSSPSAVRSLSQEPRRGLPARLVHLSGETTGHLSTDQPEIPAATGRHLHPALAVGYGFTIHRDGQVITCGSDRLGLAEVFDAEATGALEGFKDVFIEFQTLAASHGNTKIRWVPGHAKIPGNEEADALAKAGYLKPVPAGALPILAYLHRAAKQRPKDAFKAWWEESAPDKYRALELSATTRCLPELSLSRSMLHHLLAARSRHGDFAEYHERFDHADARILCSCGQRKAPNHIFYCRKVLLRC
ncbi:hypothetical protein S40285_10737 [Stachybotrys chlorohalonatus IBT 40285]|uniref:Uncharacterized protein n=1 Tax=Stachybotrys chlorohalonatus (strain IBT 40285) TaxID=1283841 RepID=A0A084QTF5_STAC4|nr:hypothetical protein S40285_10737 [Stachybotrys chlorohalonata IBT 40285]